MPEPVAAWWERRRFATGRAVPYAVGSYRQAWASFPVLVRMYHPELNQGVVLSQVPLAADVWLQWECDAGHRFVATPEEQRMRPGRQRRRSSWCPVCSEQAAPRRIRNAPEGSPVSGRPAARPKAPRRICDKTPALPVGDAFASECAPRPASAVEAELRQALEQRLPLTTGLNAVRLGRPFFDHLEAWPDILLPELRVAIEYDSTGRHGLEHVGRRQAVDERKDRALRAAGWEVLRVRTGRLAPLGPHDVDDVEAGGVSKRLLDRIVDELRRIRGPLLIDAYLR